MVASAATSPADVFVNCPFDDDYASTFQALIFAIRACGFRPRCARELDDAGQPRIEKLYDIIQECRYGIHDISRTELDPVNQLPRFKMPLELGIFMGAKRYGRPRKPERRLLIFDTEKYRYQRFISDIAGMDIQRVSVSTLMPSPTQISTGWWRNGSWMPENRRPELSSTRCHFGT